MVMSNTKKILLGLSTVALAIGGYALTKYLTRNLIKDKYITYIIVKDEQPEINSNDIP